MNSSTQTSPSHVWLMGLANMTFGYGFAVVFITGPQFLAARGVPEPVIANLTALAMATSLGTFLLAPLLDCWVSRRRWAIGLALLIASLIFAAVSLPPTSLLFAVALCATALSIGLVSSAVGA